MGSFTDVTITTLDTLTVQGNNYYCILKFAELHEQVQGAYK